MRVQRLIAVIIDGVVRFHALGPCDRVFAGNHGFLLHAEFKMLMLDDPGIGRFAVGVIHDGDALIIVRIQHLGFKPQAPVFQLSKPIAEVGVNGAGEHDFLGHRIVTLPMLQIIHAGLHIAALK